MALDPIDVTRDWIERIVIRLNLCPFASYPFQQNTIKYVMPDNEDRQDILRVCSDEMDHLNRCNPQETETTLIILASSFLDFMDYLDLIDDCQLLLEAEGYEGDIQIASFHPDYQFADIEADDVRNYTNRSPYPMIHLIREDSVSKAVESYPDIEQIPERNQELLLKLGKEYFRS